MQETEITLTGVGHWSCSRDISEQGLLNQYWSWRVSIDGVEMTKEEYLDHALDDKEGADFIKKVIPYLPSPIPTDNDHVDYPVHVPGDSTIIRFKLSEMNDANSVLKTLRENFPHVFSKIKG